MGSLARMIVAEVEHTAGPVCLACPTEHGGPGPCDHVAYSLRFRRFYIAHLDAYAAAELDGHRGAAAHELERLEREWATLPPRHSCSCFCKCRECLRLRAKQPFKDVAIEIGRTPPVTAPAPNATFLDLGSLK